jgi:beta-glucanase (GH16 family)
MNQRLITLFIIKILVGLGLPAWSQSLFDDFEGKKLNAAIWKKANTKWGENPSRGTHGGVIAKNVYIEDGNLVIRAHGNFYDGNIWGHGQRTKVGGAVFTKKKYASGSYEVRAKICPQPGALSAFWTYYYKNDSTNHEIDFEFPGRNQPPNTPKDSDITWGLMSNWTGVSDVHHRTADKYFGNQADGQYHLYRFEWHTGSDREKPRVEWYYDDKLMHTSYETVPKRASNFWIGIWFPYWIGRADFIKDYMYVDWIKITKFKEPGDVTSRRTGWKSTGKR